MLPKDWRITYQDEYLMNRTFLFTEIETNDHEHCEFCYEKVMKNEHKKMYQTLDKYYIVCENCFADFEPYFNFKVFDKVMFQNKKFSDILRTETTEIITGSHIYRFNHVLSLLETLNDVHYSNEEIIFVPCTVTIFPGIPGKTKIDFFDTKLNLVPMNSTKLSYDLKKMSKINQNVVSQSKFCLKLQ